MRTRRWLIAVALLAACDTLGPTWNVDLFVPIRYPDVPLSDYAVGGQIPPADLPFTTPVASQDVTGIVEQVLSEGLTSVRAEVLFSTATNITGTIEISIAAHPANLFSGSPSQAVTVTIPVRQTAGDTIVVTVQPTLLQDAGGGAIAELYYQTRGTMRGAPGGTPVGANDVLSLGVNLIATVTVNDTTE